MISEVVHGQEFMMEFFDNDDGYDDEFLGRATVRTAAVADRHRQLESPKFYNTVFLFVGLTTLGT